VHVAVVDSAYLVCSGLVGFGLLVFVWLFLYLVVMVTANRYR
jgi:hypothetical protein